MKKILICVLLAGLLLTAVSCSRTVGYVEQPKKQTERDWDYDDYDDPGDFEEPKEIETDQSGQNQKTNAPSLLDSMFLSQERYFISGNAAERATITIEGGLRPVETKVSDNLYMAEVFLERQKTKDVELYIYAQSSGKEKSDPLVVTVSKDEARGSIPVYVGKRNRLHYEHTLDDFLGINLFSDPELAKLREGAEKLQQRITDAGLKTELIIFIAPNHATIYPETMPDFLTEQKASADSRAKQMAKEFENSKIKLIFPTKKLLLEKSNNILYFAHDTHWNDLGAYYGYCELFEYIGERFPDALPIPDHELNIYDTTMYGGDITGNMLFVNGYDYPSITAVAQVKNPKAVLKEADGTPGQGFEIWVNDDGKNKPSVMMYRDSFSVAMISFIAESSSKFIVNPMWDFSVKMDYLKEINPDYLVIEKVERESRGFSGVLR